MYITLGSLRDRDILALEDLDLLPEDVDLEKPASSAGKVVAPRTADSDAVETSRSGTTNGISWFEDMIQGSQLGHHSKRRQGHGTSADGTTTVQWEITEYVGAAEEPESTNAGSKRKAVDIETDDITTKG